MPSEATRRAPFMSLKELTDLYRKLVHASGDPIPISKFGFSVAEAERLFSGFDEDYHISRFFHFTDSTGEKFSINGIPATHVSLDGEIETIL